MKLYIDMIAFYLQRTGGITVLWKEMIIRMLRDKWDIVLILQNVKSENIYLEEILLLNPQVIWESGKALKLTRYLPVNCPMEGGSRFLSTYYRVAGRAQVKQYTVVHDFTYEYYVKGVRKIAHQYQKKRSIRVSDAIICVSGNTKKDLLKLYPWAGKKDVCVIYNGVSDGYRHLSDDEADDSPAAPYFVYVGSRAGYKRFDLAVDIAAHYSYRLVIVGGGTLNEKEKMELKHKLKDNYIQLSGIDEEKLNQIYNKALALLYPSEYEGFGIPLLEAQKAGCPVVACKGSSISEVVADEGMLMEKSTLSDAVRMIDMLQDKEVRKRIIEKGYSNAARFSWDITYGHYRRLLQ